MAKTEKAEVVLVFSGSGEEKQFLAAFPSPLTREKAMKYAESFLKEFGQGRNLAIDAREQHFDGEYGSIRIERADDRRPELVLALFFEKYKLLDI